jgi:S1-C subfamily serine protease
MATYPMLQQSNEERVALLSSAAPRALAVAVGRKRVLSGILWRGEIAVTAAEGLAGAERVEVRSEAGASSAEIIATDLTTDVAVLRVSGSVTDSAAVASAAPRLGEVVAIVGRDARGAAAIWGTVRHVSGAWRSRRGGEIARRIELDARFDPAFEGAAVIDASGAVTAMAVPGPQRRILGIPGTTIERVLGEIERHGHLARPYLGVRLQALWLDEPASRELGRPERAVAIVAGIDSGSPAAQAHVELGDLLLRVDGQVIDGAETLARRIAAAGLGNTISLEVLRGGKPLEIEVRVGERPRE